MTDKKGKRMMKPHSGKFPSPSELFIVKLEVELDSELMNLSFSCDLTYKMIFEQVLSRPDRNDILVEMLKRGPEHMNEIIEECKSYLLLSLRK